MSQAEYERRLAAIFSADVVGYSRLMAEDELDTIRRLRAHRSEVGTIIDRHGGRVVDDPGDNVLAELSTASDAVSAALELQRVVAARNEDVEPGRRMELRIGIHVGEVTADAHRIYGNGVNIAARLEGLAAPGGICISQVVREQIRSRMAVACDDLGEQEVKNIPEPVRVFAVREAGETQAPLKVDLPVPWRDALPPPPVEKPTLAVLPFVNLSGDAGQDFFADGLTMDIQTALVKISGLELISEESTFRTRDRSVGLRELGRELRVKHVLQGGVRRDGSRVRVSAQLVETEEGRRIWAERFDHLVHDEFAVQDEITEQVVTALDVKLVSGESARIFRRMLRNPDALERYYQGWQSLFGPTADHVRQAQQHFEEVTRLEPRSPLGFALAAWAHWWEAFRNLTPDTEGPLRRGEKYARQAIELDDATGLPHLMLAHVHLLRREYDEAIAEADRAVLDRPSCEGAFAAKANILNYTGRAAEAVPLAQRAVALSPAYPPIFPAILAASYYGSDCNRDAAAAAAGVLSMDPSNLGSHLLLAASRAALGHRDAARSASEDVCRLSPAFRLDSFASTQPYQDRAELDRLLDHLRQAGLR